MLYQVPKAILKAYYIFYQTKLADFTWVRITKGETEHFCRRPKSPVLQLQNNFTDKITDNKTT